MDNLKEFIDLIVRYETIEIDEIQDVIDSNVYTDMVYVLQALTGFGAQSTCKLCLACTESCYMCVYGCDYNCTSDISYDLIKNAKNANELLLAYRNRARYMRKYLCDRNIKIN